MHPPDFHSPRHLPPPPRGGGGTLDVSWLA
jgi:hypothetical protein